MTDASAKRYGRLSSRQVSTVVMFAATQFLINASPDFKVWLDLLNAAPGSHYDPREKCLDGTRADVLENIAQWAQADTSNVFWLYGAAGTGKSTISHTVAAQMRRSLAGCFFCKRDSPAQRDASRIIPTLASQMAVACPPYGELAIAALKNDRSLGSASIPIQFEELLQTPLEKLSGMEMPNHIIVVDALDECTPERDRAFIIKSICLLNRVAPWLKFFITSRPLEDISKSFHVHAELISMDISSAESTPSDVAAYLTFCLNQVFEHHSLDDSWRPTVQEEEHMVARASGLFIWVSTVHRYLIEADDIRTCLKTVLDGRQSQTAEEGLYRLYDTVLPQSNIRADNLELLKKVLGVVVASAKHQPLTAQAISDFVQYDVYAVRRAVGKLYSVLTEDLNDIIHAYHPSFLDYMEHQHCSIDFSHTSEEINGYMVERALDILNISLRFNICGLETSYVANKDLPCLAEKVKECIPLSLQYSCLYWEKHLVFIKALSNVHVSTLRALLLSPKAIYWIEALSLMGRVLDATHILQSLEAKCIVRFLFCNTIRQT